MCGCADSHRPTIPKQTNSTALTERNVNLQVGLLMHDFEALTAVLLKFASPGMLRLVKWQVVIDVSKNTASETSAPTAVLLKFISPGMLRRVKWQVVIDVSKNTASETSVNTR